MTSLVVSNIPKVMIPEQSIFLGEWCNEYNNKENNSLQNIIPYHWDDRKKLYKDYNYLQKFQ